jgi:HEAT repeat protein
MVVISAVRFIERRSKVKMRNRMAPAIITILAIISVQSLWVPRTPAADAVTTLIADLGSENHGTQQRAKEELLVHGKKAIPQLIGALDDPNVKNKKTIMSTLGQLKATEAVPRLIEELKNENTELRLSSAYSLGLVGDSRALPHLVAMLGPGNDFTASPSLPRL